MIIRINSIKYLNFVMAVLLCVVGTGVLGIPYTVKRMPYVLTTLVCDLVSAGKLSDLCEVQYKSVSESCSASTGFVEISSVIVMLNLCV
jgi:hypothetical protein